MENYLYNQPGQYPPLTTPVQGYPQFNGLQMPNYYQGHNFQTGNMYMPANHNLNQQTAHTSNTIPQPFHIPIATNMEQQPTRQATLQVNQHKTHAPMEDYDLPDNDRTHEEPGTTTNDWQRV